MKSRLLAFVIISAPALFGQATTIADTIRFAGPTGPGALINGRINISWTAFRASDGTYKPSGNFNLTITSGVLNVALESTTNATPAGSVTPGIFYLVRYYLTNGNTRTENWQFAYSATPITMASVSIVSTVPTSFGFASTQIQQSGATDGQTLVWRVASNAWVPEAPSGGAPTTVTFITQTPSASLSAEQAMSLLATGLVKNTTATGVQSIAIAGTDYVLPGGNVATATALAANGANCSAGSYPLGVDASGAAEGCTVAGGGGGGAWGTITGILSDQTDLNTALGLKAPLASPTFTGTVTIGLLLAQSGADLGSAAAPFRDLYLNGVGSGNPISTFDPGNPDTAKFQLNLSNTANNGDLINPNPVMQWAYNLSPGGGAVVAGQTGWGWGLEGNYCPMTVGPFTNLVVDGSNNLKVTSASHTFVAGNVGYAVNITATAGWTAGNYRIVSVAAGAATLSSSPAATGTTGGNWRMNQCLNEAHFYFVDKSGAQHRRISLTGAKDDPDGTLGTWYEYHRATRVDFFNGDETAAAAQISSGTLTLLNIKTLGVPTDGVTLTSSGTTVALQSVGALTKNLSFAGWDYIGNGAITMYSSGTIVTNNNFITSAQFQSASGKLQAASAPQLIFNNTAGGTNTSDIRFQSNGTNRWQINDNGGLAAYDYTASRQVFMFNSNGAAILMGEGGAGVGIGNGATNPGANNLRVVGSVMAASFTSATNCADSAGAAACGSAAAGSVVIDAGATTVVVSTTAVTANSQIQVLFDSSLGTRLSVTCNTLAALPTVSARTASTSFTITAAAAPITNPACYSYTIVN